MKKPRFRMVESNTDAEIKFSVLDSTDILMWSLSIPKAVLHDAMWMGTIDVIAESRREAKAALKKFEDHFKQ